MGEKKLFVSEMTDSEFVSFLYSERDRENGLSQYQGWNNWAIAGALITIIYNIYTVFKNEVWLSPDVILSGFSSAVSLYLFIKSYAVVFKRERGYDYCRMRLLKDEIPRVDLALVVICSIISIAVAAILGKVDFVFWLWLVILVLNLIAVVAGVIYGDRVMPPYYEGVYFHNFKIHSCFCGLVGALCSVVLIESLKRVESDMLTPEFEVGVCLALCIILISLLVKINTGNRVVKQFDAIIDRYVYAGVSKEETYRRIQCNRVGYGAMEVCHKEMTIVRNALDEYAEKEEEISRILRTLAECDCDRDQLLTYLDFNDNLLKMLGGTLKVSERLSKRIDDIVKIVPEYTDIDELSYMVKVGRDLAAKMKDVIKKVEKVIYEIQMHSRLPKIM